MNYDTLIRLGWNPTTEVYIWTLENLLLWLPNDCDYTLITSLNNYDNTLFKGIIETDEEMEFLTKILRKGTFFE